MRTAVAMIMTVAVASAVAVDQKSTSRNKDKFNFGNALSAAMNPATADCIGHAASIASAQDEFKQMLNELEERQEMYESGEDFFAEEGWGWMNKLKNMASKALSDPGKLLQCGMHAANSINSVMNGEDIEDALY